MTTPITLEQLRDPSAGDLAQVRLIYETNFTPVEQTPFSLLADWLKSDTLMLLVARARGDQRILGMAMLLPLQDTPSTHLMYLAVDRERHDQGIGGAFFRQMIDFLSEHTDANALFWELYPARPDQPDHIDNRRIRFYKRLGASVVTEALHYVAPNYLEGGVIPCWLMWVPLRDRRDNLDRTEVAAWVSGLYALAYADRPELGRQIVAEIMAGAAG